LIKIIAGKHKNKKIYTPLTMKTRPTSSRLRETIFNILLHSPNLKLKLKNIKVLDIFSGSGAFGLESLSRGCKSCIFIDNSIESIKTINKNIEILKEEKNCKVIRANAIKPIKNKLSINLCFLDPPYEIKNVSEIIYNWSLSGWINKNAIYILEKRKKNNFKLPNNFKLVDSRKVGISEILFIKKLTSPE